MDFVKNHAFVPTIGNIQKIDEYLQAPLKFVSPGPIYDVTKQFGLKHSTKFAKDHRLKKCFSESSNAGFRYPSMYNKQKSPRQCDTSNHYQWHKTFTNEKER